VRIALTLLSLTLGFPTAQLQTANWKTFTNRAGWSIDYPAEWKISSCHSCSDVTAPDVFVSFFPPAVKDYDQGSLMIEHLADKPADKSADEWLAYVKKTHNLNPQMKEEKFTLNSLPALRVRYRNPAGSGYEMETVYIVSNSKTFAMTFDGKPGASVESLRNYTIYLRMLSTFKTNP
jgi:hypothetical protein